MDCIPDSKLRFCHAKLKKNGFIRIGEAEYEDHYYGYNDENVFHNGMYLENFETPIFDSLKVAIEELPCFDGETFVMAFPENQVCERMWFTEQQEEIGLTSRLNKWKTCYGEYKRSIYKGRNDA